MDGVCECEILLILGCRYSYTIHKTKEKNHCIILPFLLFPHLVALHHETMGSLYMHLLSF